MVLQATVVRICAGGTAELTSICVVTALVVCPGVEGISV